MIKRVKPRGAKRRSRGRRRGASAFGAAYAQDASFCVVGVEYSMHMMSATIPSAVWMSPDKCSSLSLAHKK